tara:strand:+ start:371 stop:865 length:495 start_codon:yes stop_codon:yes gene_type:complete
VKGKNIILSLGGLGVLGAGFYFYKQFKIASEVDYDFKNFRIEGASANKAVLGLDVVVKNNTNLTLKVYEVYCEVFVNESKVGEIKNQSLTLVPKNSTSSIPLKINVNLSDFGISLKEMFSSLSNAKGSEVKIKGTMDFGTGFVRVGNYKFDYSENLSSVLMQSI